MEFHLIRVLQDNHGSLQVMEMPLKKHIYFIDSILIEILSDDQHQSAHICFSFQTQNQV